MIWRKSVLLAGLAAGGLVLQTSVFGRMTLAGTKPEILLLLTIALAIADGAATGAVAGFVLGLAGDLLVDGPAGIGALTGTVIGASVGTIRQQFQAPSAWMPMIMVAVATFAGVLAYGAASSVLSTDPPPLGRVFRHATLASVYGALLTPFVFPVIRRLVRAVRPPAGVIA